MSINTPIALFIYKRSSNIEAITRVLKVVEASTIYIVSDGARPGEEADCKRTRLKLERHIDWKCKIYKNYSKTNQGLKRRFKSGLDWIFKNEEKVIVIEDDCIPSPTFFRFCEELLGRYQDDFRIKTISGDNFQFGKNESKHSYYFSKYPHVWGWATWKRVWNEYDSDLLGWKNSSRGNKGWLKSRISSPIMRLYWEYIFNLMANQKINTWDYQLTYLSLSRGGLNIIPNVNLVKNIGFDSKATHTKRKSRTMDMEAKHMKFPLIHPKVMEVNELADSFTEKNVYINPLIAGSLIIKSLLGKL